MTEIIEALQQAYEAFNRGDIQDCLNALDPDIEWIEPAEFAGGGTYYGHAGVAQYLTQSRQAWADLHSEPEEFIQAGEHIVVFVHARIPPKGTDEVREAAQLRTPLSETTWVIWRYEWPFDAGHHTFEVRCVEGDGTPQIEEIRSNRPSGATGIHSREANL